MVNTPYLDEKIKSSGKSFTYLAKKCGMSRSSFYNKKNGVRSFTENEATVLCDELGIKTLAERKNIFLP